MAGQTTQDCGRQKTRGWGDGGRSASCPRGTQRATINVLPTTTLEVTPPQWGGCVKISPHDPARLVARYHSSRWRKDLDYVLKVYYKHNAQASYKEAEWVKTRDLFFAHLLPYREEALDLKERSPMDFMPFIEEQFWRVTGLCLNGLWDFTAWIKQESYYHGLVAQQGHLHRCSHLTGVPLPRWPQVKPSESHQNSHKRVETLAAGSSEPSTGATMAPVQETPAEEPPVTETPVAKAPAARSDTPAPMETGGVGDGQSWAEQVEAGIEVEFQQDRPAKCCRSLSRKQEVRPMLPFPLQDSEGRLASILRLYEHVGEQPVPRNDVAGRAIMHLHLDTVPREARHLRNQVICMIAEYHLTSSARGLSSLSPVLLEVAKPLLPPIKSYVSGVAFEGTRDVRVVDRAKTL